MDEQSTARNYSYLTSEIEAAYHEAALKCGVTDSAMRILYAICLHGEACPLSAVIALSGISKQTINSALRKLERAGILYLKNIDGKKKQVLLTEAGKAVARRSALRVIDMEKQIFDLWPPEERALYLALTEKFLLSFREKTKEL